MRGTQQVPMYTRRYRNPTHRHPFFRWVGKYRCQTLGTGPGTRLRLTIFSVALGSVEDGQGTGRGVGFDSSGEGAESDPRAETR